MLVRTKSNSIYEIDQDNKRIRRVSGINQPTARIGTDGNWRSYQDIIDVAVGSSMIIMWSPADTPPLPDTSIEEGGAIMPITQTSVVEEIIHDPTTKDN